MKSKVHFSNYCKAVTLTVIIALGMVIYQSHLPTGSSVFAIVIFSSCCSAAYFIAR